MDAVSSRVEARHRALLDAIPDLMFRLSRKGEYRELAGDMSKLAHAPEEILGRNVLEILPAEVSTPLLGAIERALQTGSLATTDYRLQTVDGGVKDFEARVVPCGDAVGEAA